MHTSLSPVVLSMLIAGCGDGGFVAATELRVVEPEAVGWSSTVLADGASLAEYTGTAAVRS